MKDHYGYSISQREDLEENVVYRGSGVERAIPQLVEGDEIRIQRVGKSYPQINLTVDESKGDHCIVYDDNNKFYNLWYSRTPATKGRGSASPWLRSYKENQSKGKVKRLTILNLS